MHRQLPADDDEPAEETCTVDAVPDPDARRDDTVRGRHATVEDVRSLALGLERSYEVFVRGRRKFRVGSIVYLAFSADESIIGFGFPKEERAALVGGAPEKFLMPSTGDLRFNWVLARLAALDPAEARELVVDAWRMVVPKKLAAAYDEQFPAGPGPHP